MVNEEIGSRCQNGGGQWDQPEGIPTAARSGHENRPRELGIMLTDQPFRAQLIGDSHPDSGGRFLAIGKTARLARD